MLFEYGNWRPVNDPSGLQNLLINTWRDQVTGSIDEEKRDSQYQPFLSFDNGQIRARNYIGFIQHGDELIELYPKVFRHLQQPDKNLMLQHVFYWFSYCRKWRFPFSQASLDNREVDSFPELIIYLMSKQLLDTVASHPFMQYHTVEEKLSTPRGSINFTRYVNRGLSNGNHHHLECDHEPLVFDNKVNRIIKYCSRLLLSQTRYAESQRTLQDVLFILDEVEDVQVRARDVDTVTLNLFYEDYRLVLEMCKSILNQHLYSHQAYDTSQWCLLFPMEYIFEDFIAGFLETHFSDRWDVHYQKSDMSLASEPDAFQLQHDIFLTERGKNLANPRTIIIDTKYKLREYHEGDEKLGVVQSDLYQLVSYAYRRGCKECVLIYPNVSEIERQLESFKIVSGFGSEVITVSIVEVPFWSMEGMMGMPVKNTAMGGALTERLMEVFKKL